MISGGQLRFSYSVVAQLTHLTAVGDDGLIVVWAISRTIDFKCVQIIKEPSHRWGQICVLLFQEPRGSAGYPIETIVAGTGQGYLTQWREDETQVSDPYPLSLLSRCTYS